MALDFQNNNKHVFKVLDTNQNPHREIHHIGSSASISGDTGESLGLENWQWCRPLAYEQVENFIPTDYLQRIYTAEPSVPAIKLPDSTNSFSLTGVYAEELGLYSITFDKQCYKDLIGGADWISIAITCNGTTVTYTNSSLVRCSVNISIFGQVSCIFFSAPTNYSAGAAVTVSLLAKAKSLTNIPVVANGTIVYDGDIFTTKIPISSSGIINSYYENDGTYMYFPVRCKAGEYSEDGSGNIRFYDTVSVYVYTEDIEIPPLDLQHHLTTYQIGDAYKVPLHFTRIGTSNRTNFQGKYFVSRPLAASVHINVTFCSITYCNMPEEYAPNDFGWVDQYGQTTYWSQFPYERYATTTSGSTYKGVSAVGAGGPFNGAIQAYTSSSGSSGSTTAWTTIIEGSPIIVYDASTTSSTRQEYFRYEVGNYIQSISDIRRSRMGRTITNVLLSDYYRNRQVFQVSGNKLSTRYFIYMSLYVPQTSIGSHYVEIWNYESKDWVELWEISDDEGYISNEVYYDQGYYFTKGRPAIFRLMIANPSSSRTEISCFIGGLTEGL